MAGAGLGAVHDAPDAAENLRRAALEGSAGDGGTQSRSDGQGDGGEDRGLGLDVDLCDLGRETGGEGR
jgi:hypothetical protein